MALLSDRKQRIQQLKIIQTTRIQNREIFTGRATDSDACFLTNYLVSKLVRGRWVDVQPTGTTQSELG